MRAVDIEAELLGFWLSAFEKQSLHDVPEPSPTAQMANSLQQE